MLKKTMIYSFCALIILMSVYWIYGWNRGNELTDARELTEIVAEHSFDGYETAIFAGGCFWCMEPPFEKLRGVLDVVSGYIGGEETNPSYKEVSAGLTGHIEAVRIRYHPDQVEYEDLLEVFWRQIDPTDQDGQFIDRGSQYRSAIFVQNEEQRQLAIQSKQQLDQSGRFEQPIVTEILESGIFYEAEAYHQDYYKKNAVRYAYYRNNSGRDQFLDRFWGADRKLSLAEKGDEYTSFNKEERLGELTSEQYEVTQNNKTERAFDNPYWDLEAEGIYVDIVSGEPLFSSLDKYESGTGWPSFTKPLASNHIVYEEDRSLFGVRIEVRSLYADSHLGHVFDDGPLPSGLRYCLNSAALRFVASEDLAAEGYEVYSSLFTDD